MTTGRLTLDGTSFRDAQGRQVILRGVNLGGDSKLPVKPDGRTHLPTDFSDHRTVSFVGRPAPLGEIDAHLARIAHWGFNCLRLLTTWEAVEHAGPGEYDEAYLDYFAEVCRRAGRYGLRVFIDFHQDVWSRMSGGDGAPGWTFEAAGLDFTRFHAADAALVMQHSYDHRRGGRQAAYPTMAWGGNYARPANGIMWTLFFAGSDFAPGARIDGIGVQNFLQDCYFGAMHAVAERVAPLDNVIGFDTLNEPGTGYIGRRLDEPLVLGGGPIWTPLDGLAVASGMTRELPELRYGVGLDGTRRVNEAAVSIWLPARSDPFRDAGAWAVGEDGKPLSLVPDYFQRRDGRAVDHERDYMVPFFSRAAETVRAVRPDWIVFAEINPFDAARGHGFPEGMPPETVNASHWYDISALMTKRFSAERMIHVLTGDVRNGAQAIEDSYVEELQALKAVGDKLNGGAPTLIGECGIPYDLNEAAAYHCWAVGERSPDIWQAQTTAIDLMYNALDRLLLSSTQWNYTASNRNDAMIGDGWNQEDLSIWSSDQMAPNDPVSGGRAVEGFCRPYVRSAQGTIVSQRFDRASGEFVALIDIDPAIAASTEIYAPRTQYPNGWRSHVGAPADVEEIDQGLRIRATDAGPLRMTVERK